MGSKVDPTGHWPCQSRPCLASATAGEYSLPEDDAGEAAISQQCYPHLHFRQPFIGSFYRKEGIVGAGDGSQCWYCA